MTTSHISRRDFLAGSAIVASGGVAAACAAPEEKRATTADPDALASMVQPFSGQHQAGIATPAQAHVNLVAFTLRPGVDRKGLIRLMKVWTDDARRLCAGETPLGDLEPEMTVTPANLTITCGFGARLFDIIGEKVPEWVAPIKPFSRDKLDDKWGAADLVLQICGDDPLALSHATRHLVRAGIDYAAMRWMQQGFLHAHGSKDKGQTPRNLFGQIDGTVNPRTNEDLGDQVWIDEGPQWARGGTVMVVRRIKMNLDTWEILDRESREISMGRRLDNGAPLTGKEEFDKADFDAVDEFGLPVIDKHSHMARAVAPKDHPEQKLLRRAYNYDLPVEPGSEQTANAGLVFICFQKNPKRQFEPIQQRLDEADRLNQWIEHVGSAVFFIPPGVSNGKFWGAELLGG